MRQAQEPTRCRIEDDISPRDITAAGGGRGGTYNTRNRAFYMLLRRFNVIINHGGCERGVRMPLAELNFVGSNGLPL